MIAVIDYGAGNLKSITNALDFLNAPYKVADTPSQIEKADKIIFPGVGSFGDCISSLKKKKLFSCLKKELEKGKKPYLGICLGLQVLFQSSEESPGVKGISILKGRCRKFRSKNLKIPQIGWNSIKIKDKSSPLFSGIRDSSYFYFVHSYYVDPEDKKIISAKTDYCISFTSAVRKDNIFAVQFHPERSGDIGIRLLKNFVSL
ncbi:imidazole glycerol phosphate synthase subunit HisH [Candidatus Woesearchaeota archaeon]|nr:imidazole glycerol phosphate synthase subunit HisH [Candidatus Woesearchaeota archaeon]